MPPWIMVQSGNGCSSHGGWCRATVEATGTSAMDAVAASGNTVTIRIDEILHGPKEFADHRGRVITPCSERATGLAEGNKAIFFTRSWLYGKGIAVVEVGRVEERGTADMSEEIETAQRAIADQRLLERISGTRSS